MIECTPRIPLVIFVSIRELGKGSVSCVLRICRSTHETGYPPFSGERLDSRSVKGAYKLYR